MVDDIVDMMRARISMAGQPLMMPTETCAVIVNRIEELEKQLAEEKRYFKEVNEKAWDVHTRVHQLEKQAEHLVYALKTIVRVDNPKEWHGFCQVLIEETLKILEGKNDR